MALAQHRRTARMRGVYASLVLGVLAAGLAVMDAGCASDDQRPRGIGSPPVPDAGDWIDLGGDPGPPDPDAGGLCGNELHQLIIDAPNLYFVLDASGSMATDVPGIGDRYDAVRIAVVDLVRKLGPLVNVGAAVLPKKGGVDWCVAGTEVFPVTQGDPITGEDGPTTTALRLSTITKPVGGTPISATLTALTPTWLGLSGETYVVIATDGAPNCNEMASCDASECGLNIEGQCSPGMNCCAPGGFGGPAHCVDRPATVAAIKTLAAAGIHVVTVGIPGSDAYATVLDEMAVAGGLPRPATPKYYRVDQLEEISSVLAEIAKVAVTCEFELIDPPMEQGMTNVYLDNEVLPYDMVNGWIWSLPGTVRLVGEACARVQSGKVASVQIVSGCPTEIPK